MDRSGYIISNIDYSKMLSIEELEQDISSNLEDMDSATMVAQDGITVLEDLQEQQRINEDVLSSDKEVTVDDVISSQEALALALGKLGLTSIERKVSIEQHISLRNKLTISNEEISDIAKKIVEKIKMIFKKIWEWIKEIGRKFHLLWIKLHSKIKRIDKDFRMLTNKNDVELSSTTVTFFKEHFASICDGDPNKLINQVDKILKGFTSIPKDGALTLDGAELLDFGNKDDFKNLTHPEGKLKYFISNSEITYINGRHVRGFIATVHGEDNKGRNDGSADHLDYFDTKLPEVNKTINKMYFNKVQELANSVYNTGNSIFKIQDGIKKAETEIMKSIKKLESSSENNNYLYRNLQKWAAHVPNDRMQTVIYFARYLYKFLRLVYTDTAKNSDLLYRQFMEYISKVKNLSEIGLFDIPTDGIKYVNENDKGYISIPSENMENSPLRGGFVFLNRKTSDGLFYTDIIDEKDDINKPFLTAMKSGIIFLETDLQDLLPAISSLSKDFVYYHELGHIVTGQNESPINVGELKSLDHGVLYTHTSMELRADAFAAIKTGVSLEKVAWARCKDMFDIDFNDNSKTPAEQTSEVAIKNMQKLDLPVDKDSFQAYVNRLKKAAQEVKELSKLTWRDHLKYYVKL